MTFQIVQEYNGLALQIVLEEASNTTETELIRAFLREHADSHLVLIPTGRYYGEGIRRSFVWWQISKRQQIPFSWRTWLREKFRK